MTEECKSPMVIVTNDSSQIIESEHLNPSSTQSEELSSVIKDESVLNGKYPHTNHQYCANTICYTLRDLAVEVFYFLCFFRVVSLSCLFIRTGQLVTTWKLFDKNMVIMITTVKTPEENHPNSDSNGYHYCI